MSSISQTPNQCPAEQRRMTGQDLHSGVLEYRLTCGRNVRLEECHIALSQLGFLAGRETTIRAKVIEQLPARVRAQFPGNYGLLIKPVPDGELPTYTFMAVISCDHPISDPSSDFSTLIICWLSDDIQTPLLELIRREIFGVEWDMHAVDGRT